MKLKTRKLTNANAITAFQKLKQQQKHLIVSIQAGNLAGLKRKMPRTQPDLYLHFDNQKPLREAIRAGHLDIVEYLVERGAVLEPPGQDHLYSLVEAITSRRTEITQYLINQKVDVCCYNQNPLRVSIEIQTSAELVELLLKAGAHLRDFPDYRYPPFSSTDHIFPLLVAKNALSASTLWNPVCKTRF